MYQPSQPRLKGENAPRVILLTNVGAMKCKIITDIASMLRQTVTFRIRLPTNHMQGPAQLTLTVEKSSDNRTSCPENIVLNTFSTSDRSVPRPGPISWPRYGMTF